MKPDRPCFFHTVLLLIHLLFFLVALFEKPFPLADSEEYLNASKNIYNYGKLYCGDLEEPVRMVQYTRRPPLYPVFLGLALATGSKIPLFLLQIMLSLLSIWLVMKLFAPNEERKRTYRLMAFFFLLATPAQFIYANRIMSEVLFQLMIVLSAWSLFSFFNQHKSRYIWLFYLFLTLGMATKPVLFPFAILIVPFSIFLFSRSGKRTFLLAVMLPLIWIAGYSYRNYRVTGSVEYSSIQTANLINYNLRYYLMKRESSEAASEAVDKLYALCEDEAYLEMNRCLRRGAQKIILDQPLSYVLFHMKGSLHLFIDPGRFDIVKFFGIQQSDAPGFLRQVNQQGLSGAIHFLKQHGWWLVLLLGVIAVFKLLKIAGFLIFLFRKKEGSYPEGEQILRIYLALLVGYVALVTGPLGASRFLLPLELILIGGAVRGWMSILSRSRLRIRESA